jgi:uridylate kinase
LARFLLKLSGEALGGEAGFGIEPSVLEAVCDEIVSAREAGIELAIVLGGGNVFRGQALAAAGLGRVSGDRMGMLATVMNGVALTDYLNRRNIPTALFSAFEISGHVQGYRRDLAMQKMQDGDVVILTGGTGNPYFTTDTAACLRGIELDVDAVLKATNVDGIYDSDPKINPTATKFDEISYDEVLRQELGVMDMTAIVLCKEQGMPLVVFAMEEWGSLVKLANGAAVGTKVVAHT